MIGYLTVNHWQSIGEENSESMISLVHAQTPLTLFPSQAKVWDICFYPLDQRKDEVRDCVFAELADPWVTLRNA